VRCDVCVVGSGPAGLAIAMELSKAGKQVCLLESGGLEYEDDTQDLYSGESVGWVSPLPLNESRMRFFGGSSNCWAGMCGILDEVDFKPRPWVAHSGWPIGQADLLPYYRRAAVLLGVTHPIVAGGYAKNASLTELPFDRTKLTTGYLYGATVWLLGRAYREAIRGARNIDLILHANLTELKLNAAGKSVVHAQARSLSGKAFTVQATHYVVACGGIENARILLYSNSVAKAGVGNDHDLVGRFMMDHPLVPMASLMPERDDTRASAYNNTALISREKNPLFACVRFSDTFQQEHRLLNSAVYLVDHEEEFGEGLRASMRIRRSYLQGTWPENLGGDFWKILRNIGEVAPAVYDRMVGNPGVRPRIALKLQAEQAPNWNSRVLLSRERDRLGLQRATLNWQISKEDRTSAEKLVTVLAAELGRLRTARVKLDSWVSKAEPLFPDDLRGGQHHIGTTRMSDDPRSGVVDKNCRVHSTDNLYIAGSSVFPTSGWVNPTFTICALAIRLADHLAGRR
jgi:choline dehydrogenase-like flavoprotein